MMGGKNNTSLRCDPQRAVGLVPAPQRAACMTTNQAEPPTEARELRRGLGGSWRPAASRGVQRRQAVHAGWRAAHRLLDGADRIAAPPCG